MGLLIFLGIFIFVLIMANSGEPTGYTGKNEKPFCPPHKWEYGTDGFLYCTMCNNKPGYDARS